MAEIRVKKSEIHVDEKGRVVITNPALAKALAEEIKKPETSGGDSGGGFLDWKCTNVRCGLK